MVTKRTLRGLTTVITVLLACAASAAGASTSFRLAVIGDRTDEAQDGIYEGILDEVERLRPDFAITVGDAIQGYTDDTTTMNSEWQEYLSIVKRLSVPLRHTPGNHDITTDVMRPYYERYIGPAYHSFDYGDCHFVVLDNTPGGGGAAEPLDEGQWNWLVNDLTAHAEARYTFVFCHKPFWYENRFENKPDSLHDLLVRHGVDAVFTGHYHRYFTAELDGIKYTGVGSSGGDSRTPFKYLQYHFVWVTVDGDGIHIAPIDHKSVLPWDYTTAEQLQLANRIEDSCIRVLSAVRLDSNLTIHDGQVALKLRNLNGSMNIRDSLRWEDRPGWTIEPAVMPVTIGPGEESACIFRVNCEANLFPPPVARLRHPLAENVDIVVEQSLWLARTAHCIRVISAVAIDGELSELYWRKPTTTLFSSDGSSMVTDSVWFYFAYDQNNLYLGALCRENVMDSLRSQVTERDGAVYGEDCVGFFFCNNDGLDTVFQIYINPLGTVFDQKIVWDYTGWYETDRDWNGDYEIATSKGDDYWTLEARIPLAELGATGRTSAPWLVNFRRKHKRFGSSADWQVPIDYDPHTYGYLEFAK